MDTSGGEFVENGSYGCVFRPAIPCVKNSITLKPGMVSKVFDDAVDAKEEQRFNLKINKLDPKNEFTVKSYGTCDTDLLKAKEEDIYECRYIDSKYFKPKQIIYEDGGIELTDIIHYPRYFKNIYFEDFIPLWLPLVKALVVMKDAGVHHCDIRPANILYNPDTHRLTFIDFGILTTTAQFKKTMIDSALFTHTTSCYPPEMKIFDAVYKHGKRIKVPLVSIQANFSMWRAPVYEVWNFLSAWTPTTESIASVYKRYIAMSDNDMLKEIPVIRTKLDTYSLGMTIMEVYFNMNKHYKYKNKDYCKRFVKNVAVPMINFDVHERATPEEALQNIEDFLRR
jgi:serine/threonine protein kinase